MNSFQTALKTAIIQKNVENPKTVDISQCWTVLSSAEKAEVLQLFLAKIKETPKLVLATNYDDPSTLSLTGVDSINFPVSTDQLEFSLQSLSTPCRVRRQISYDDCVFRDLSYSCTGLIKNSFVGVSPLGIKVIYQSQTWVTEAGMQAFLECLAAVASAK